MALTDFLTQIADAIRSKDGTSDAIVATDFPQRILNIPSGGGSDLPDTIKTGTFTVAEDTIETITIPHGLGVTPTIVLILSDNIDYAIRKIPYAILGGIDISEEKIVTSNSGALTVKYGIMTITNDNTNIVITVSNSNYKMIAGLVYRWFAWV